MTRGIIIGGFNILRDSLNLYDVKFKKLIDVSIRFSFDRYTAGTVCSANERQIVCITRIILINMRLFIANLIGLRSKSYLPRYTFNNLPWTVYNSNSGEGKGKRNEGSSN